MIDEILSLLTLFTSKAQENWVYLAAKLFLAKRPFKVPQVVICILFQICLNFARDYSLKSNWYLGYIHGFSQKYISTKQIFQILVDLKSLSGGTSCTLIF